MNESKDTQFKQQITLGISLKELERYIDYKEAHSLGFCPYCKAPNATLNKRQNPNTVLTLCTVCQVEFIEFWYKREITAVAIVLNDDVELTKFRIK